jgi:O-antigen/teichoic acid export membrane protein
MDKPSLGGRLLRSSSAATFSQVWRMGVTFLTQAILRRLVAPDDWGFWHWAVDFLFVILGQVRDLGLPAQLVRDPARPYGPFLAVEVGWGALLSIAFAAGAPILVLLSPDSSLHAVPLLQALVLFFFFEGLAKVPLTYFEAEIRIDRVLWPEIARNLCYVAVSLSLAFAGYGVWSLLVAHVAASAVFAGMLWWRAYGEMPLGWTRGSVGPLLRSSLPLMLMAIVLLAVETVDYQVIGLRFSDEVVGLYGGALTLALMVTRVVEWPLRRALYPTFVEVRHDPVRFFATYRLSTILLLAIHVPVAGVLFLNASAVLGLVWGESYFPAAGYLELLCLVPLVQPFARCAEDVLLPRHEERILTASAVINLAALGAVGYWLTGVLGPEGMAWAKLLPVGTVLVIWAIERVDPDGFRRLGLDVLAMYGVAVALFAAAAWIGGGDDYLRLGLSVLAGAASVLVYAGLYGRAFREFFQGT